jgi:hypothetical protein
MMTGEEHRMRKELVAVVEPEVPADRPAPADAVMKIVAAPVPAAAVPAAIVPTISVSGVPVVFGFRIVAVAALAVDGHGPCDIAADPALARHLIALRQHQRRSPRGGRAIERDAQAGRVHDPDFRRIGVERLQFPNLMIAAVALVENDRIAGARGLAAIAGEAVEAKPARRQVVLALVAESLIWCAGAIPQREMRAGLILRAGNIDAGAGGRGRQRRPE